MITCSEKCIYENEELCTLKSVTPSSDTPIKDCPYYKEREKKR